MNNFFYHLKITLRNLRRGGIYSVINIGGLAIGMAATMFIMLWVYHQWSYDRFHEKEKQLYSVWNHHATNGIFEYTSRKLGPALVEDYKDIANMTRFEAWPHLITYGDKKINMETAIADPGFLTMFNFPLLEGDKNTALNNSHAVILTKDVAIRLFGEEDPIGKDVIVQNRYPATVTAVIADLPANTGFKFKAILSYLSFKETIGYNESWSNNSTITYVELQPGADATTVNSAIKDVVKRYTDDNNFPETFLYPITKWHLYSKVENEKAASGLIGTVRLFGLIGLLILVIACINFMNLSTARSAKRGREVGVQKVIGARRITLIRQFLGESLLTAAIASIFALVIVSICLPFFNTVMGEYLYLDFGNIGLWVALLVFILFTGILAGSYPAFYLSSFLPVKVLKGVFKNGSSLVTSRKVLIVTQFTFAIMLILSTVVIHRQIRYAQDRNTGYNKDQLIYVELNEQMEKNKELIRNELLGTGAAVSVTRTTSPMTGRRSSTWGIDWQGKDPEDRTTFNCLYVDSGWTETTGTIILQGRDIDPYTYATDSTAFLLNETAVKHMGFGEPIGQVLRDGGKDWHVIGVVKDFVIESPYDPIKPMVVGGPAGWLTVMHIKLNGANRMADNLAQAEQTFKTYNPDFPFEYTFVDESYAQKFAEEQRINTLIAWFTGLAVFISCLGLFGLSAYMAENRRKEIGIRKVLGASVLNITSLLSKEFLILVMISLAIAVPVSWWLMNQWLSGYAYRTNMPWWLFTTVGVLTIGIALFTVSWQAIKAATTNPAKIIKSE